MSTTITTTPTPTMPAKKTIKTITFRRPVVLNYCECYELTYKDFAAKIRKDGWDGKEVKDGSIIKKLWDELAEATGCDDVIDLDDDVQQDGEDNWESWDEEDAEEKVWDYILNDMTFEDCFPECAEEGCSSTVINEGEKCEDCSKTPEQREKEAAEKEKEKANAEKKAGESAVFWAKRNAEAAERIITARNERIENAPEVIRNAILSAAKLYEVEPTATATIAEDEQWKIKAMKNVARIRLLDQMKDLVVQLKMVAKW